MTGRRLDAGGTWIDRSRPIRVHVRRPGHRGVRRRHGRERAARYGRARRVPSRPLQGRPRGVVTAGVEEPNAFVEVSAPWFEPIRPATMVNLVDGLVGRRRAGVGRLPDAAVDPRAARHTHRHVEPLVDRRRARRARGGAGRRRAGRTRAAGRRAPRRARAAARSVDHPCETTTATGIYDDGYVAVLPARRRTRRDPARPRRPRGAGDRRPRAAPRVRRQRPPRRDARIGRQGLSASASACWSVDARRRVLHEPRRP